MQQWKRQQLFEYRVHPIPQFLSSLLLGEHGPIKEGDLERGLSMDDCGPKDIVWQLKGSQLHDLVHLSMSNACVLLHDLTFDANEIYYSSLEFHPLYLFGQDFRYDEHLTAMFSCWNDYR